ncbi:response regulator [Fulvivirga sediminis]|uniref:Response regulator n=1 Tax=Fulvivirga sediminis TaxID=2803949 RepID=A0A937FAK2_9BACT|nr:response regulator [Fulvivirga sediminis]MBL3658351.1 response regulator [Fulvivirga sediminis]
MKKTVLICDDDKDILELCTFILNKDYNVKTSPHVMNIVELVTELNPDLILMDLWIPDIGGEQAVNLLRKEGSTQSVPVVLFSANDEIERIAEKVKADGVIRKPFSVKNLKDYISSILS